MRHSLPSVLSCALALSGIALFTPNAVQACATCLCGDPTLTTLGNEKPFAGRLRASLTTLYREESTGRAGYNQRTVEEWRHTLGLGYWASDTLALEMRLPWADKSLEDDSLATQETRDWGDIEISARVYLWQDRVSRPRHLLGLTLGSRLPTAERQKDRGEYLDNDVQPGAGVWIPQAGVWYGFYQYPWSVNASASVNVGLDEGYEHYTFGGAFNTSLTGQYALTPELALQLGLDSRNSRRDKEDGVPTPDSGGHIVYLVPGLAYDFASDWMLSLKVQSAIVDGLNGDHDEDQVTYLGVAHDF